MSTHSLTHTLLSLTKHSLSLSLSLTPSLTELSLYSHSHSLHSHSHSLTLTHSHSLSLTLSHTQSRHSLTLRLRQSLFFAINCLRNQLLYLTTSNSTMSALSPSEQSHDITPQMAPYLDVHMISPVLDYLREVGLSALCVCCSCLF
jgi:hypothetical protein